MPAPAEALKVGFQLLRLCQQVSGALEGFYISYDLFHDLSITRSRFPGSIHVLLQVVVTREHTSPSASYVNVYRFPVIV